MVEKLPVQISEGEISLSFVDLDSSNVTNNIQNCVIYFQKYPIKMRSLRNLSPASRAEALKLCREIVAEQRDFNRVVRKTIRETCRDLSDFFKDHNAWYKRHLVYCRATVWVSAGALVSTLGIGFWMNREQINE